jgi:outer membrane protein assembly factor BamB
VLVSLVVVTMLAGACEWAQLGGSGGRSFDNAGDTSFTPASLATMALRWSVPVGDRYSQPVVAGGALYLTANDANGVKVVSLAASDGATRWTQVLPSTSDEAGDAAPAVAGDLVFVTTGGALVALDAASGATRWSAPSQTLGSPIVAGDLVYLGPSAFDVSTGAVRWTAPANTAIQAVTGGRAIATSSYPCTGSPAGGSVMALDATTGATLWTQHLDGDLVRQLMVSGGTVVVMPASCVPLFPSDGLLDLNAASGATLAWWDRGFSVAPQAVAHGLLLQGFLAENVLDGSLTWHATTGVECALPIDSPTIVVAGSVEFMSNSSVLCAFDVDTGSQLGHWTFATAFDMGLSLIAADGCVYATSEYAGIDSINALCIAS